MTQQLLLQRSSSSASSTELPETTAQVLKRFCIRNGGFKQILSSCNSWLIVL
jgi:hypothetical protein